jgi:hypothetical protein
VIIEGEVLEVDPPRKLVTTSRRPCPRGAAGAQSMGATCADLDRLDPDQRGTRQGMAVGVIVQVPAPAPISGAGAARVERGGRSGDRAASPRLLAAGPPARRPDHRA